LAAKGHLSALLVHVDHNLRPESAADADRAIALARQLDLPISVREIPPGLRERHPGVGIEEAARRERYLLLADAAAEFGTNVIAVGHHQGDQVESVLLHLLRGAGLKGAAGMSEATTLEIPWWEGEASPRRSIRLWRPLLAEPKREIDEFVEASGLAPILDRSNESAEFRRNQIRQTVLPAMESVFPESRAAIARFAEIARLDDELLESETTRALSRALDESSLMRRELLQEHPALQYRVVARWLAGFVPGDAISLDRVAAVVHLAESNTGGKRIEIGAHISVALMGGKLIAEHDS
jgi:tRNA(Ile)-lysidine synthase